MNEDWDSVTTIGQRAGANHSANARTNSQVNAARRTGAVVATDKKYGAGGNKTVGTEGQRLAKIDRENEVAPPAKIDISVGKAISKARLDKKLTQKDLAVKVNEKANVINDYEMGRAVPNQQLLGKLERVLGVKLRGHDIGAPLHGPKK
ncbi:multi protein bridging factor 1-domain-containing protein [Limtongia smithiae]|uniref:multi protein bridging factor 1-domain-containing protein n=1 Tax=Limtongia smithiae TaxID=1125753 RepID=UPI0034CF4803